MVRSLCFCRGNNGLSTEIREELCLLKSWCRAHKDQMVREGYVARISMTCSFDIVEES